MFDPLLGDGLDFLGLAELSHSRRLRLQERRLSAGPLKAGVIAIDNDPELLVRHLIRLAAIGHVFATAARDDPDRSLRGIRDLEARVLDAQLQAALAGRPIPSTAALERAP